MRSGRGVVLMGLALGAGLGAGCNKGEPGGATATGTAGAAVESPWRARVKAAAAAFPASPVATCTAPIGRALVLSGKSAGEPVKRLSFCRGGLGNDEAWMDYRSNERDAWQTRLVEGATKIVLFQPSNEVAPKVAGNTLTPGTIEGRAVVFSLEGVPECEVAVRAVGPDKATSKASENADSVVQKGLCHLAGSAIRAALPK